MKQHAPAAERNKGPLLEVLRRVLPARGLVLEIAGGSGQHAAHFAAALPGLVWQPSDVSDAALASLEAHARDAALPNLLPPLRIDASRPGWERAAPAADAIVCINMIHAAPWQAGLGLFCGAGALLAPGAPLVLYGPFRRAGAFTAPSDEAFDAWLKSADPAFGVRDLEVVTEAAEAAGLAREDVVPMPANNFVVLFRRAGGGERG